MRLSALPVDVFICTDAADSGDDTPAGIRTIGGRRISMILAGRQGLYASFVKGAVDRCIALAAIALLFPLLGIIALAVKFDSPGAILFRQPRLGQCGTVFEILEFRTMRQDACDPSGRHQARVDGPRVTPLGKFLRELRIPTQSGH